MAKVMVFTNGGGAEWESRAGVVTVRSAREVAHGLPRRQSGLTHLELHKFSILKFKELRDE